jgi:prepilin-type processing-associated H-X9-DG protein
MAAEDRDDDELDKKPRKRSRDRDDEDDDGPSERPARKGMSTGMIIGIIAGVLFMFLIVPCLAILIGLLLPAVSKVRQAAGRQAEANNMKQIALGQFAHSDVTNSFAGPFHTENGQVNRNMSWRVSILPYIEQDNVFRMLDRTQPWDSPKNIAGTSLVIRTFTTPEDGPNFTNRTPFKAFVGGGALFDDAPGAKPVNLMSITDGSSNTILFIHAMDQVPWASPQDIKYGPGIPLPKFGHINNPNAGYNVAMADGSVKFMAPGASEATLRAMITKAGND